MKRFGWRNRKQERGFSILEAVVTAGVMVLAVTYGTRLLTQQSKAIKKSNAAPQAAYWEELLVERTSKFLGTLQYWMANVPWGCRYGGWMLHGFGYKVTPTGWAAVEIRDLMRYLNTSGQNTSDPNRIMLLEGPLQASPWQTHKDLFAWYTKTKATQPDDPYLLALEKCTKIDAYNTGGVNGFHPLTNVQGQFRFCVILETSLDPAQRAATINGGRLVPKWQFAVVEAQFYEILQGQPLSCQDIPDPIAPGYWQSSTFMGEINRGVNAKLTLYAIENSDQPATNQIRFSSSRSFWAPKSGAAVVNCNVTDNAAEEAWQFKCCSASIDAGGKTKYNCNAAVNGTNIGEWSNYCKTIGWCEAELRLH